MGLLDTMREEAKKSGANKKKIIYFRDGQKTRIRFLTDMEEGLTAVTHDSYKNGVSDTLCREMFDENCDMCDDKELRTRNQYVWSVWDYEAGEVKLLMQPNNQCTAVPHLISLYDNYTTLLDRDYMITRNGSGTSQSYSVIPMDKVKFRVTKAKELSREKTLQILEKAFSDTDDIDDDDEKPKRKSKKAAPKKSNKKEKEETDSLYDGMSARELYKECVERGLDVEIKKPAKHYINALEEDDLENANESDDSDDWDDEENSDEIDYSDMTAQELYKLCKEREIDCLTKKPAKYYIKLLEENDKTVNDWDDDEEDTDDDW